MKVLRQGVSHRRRSGRAAWPYGILLGSLFLVTATVRAEPQAPAAGPVSSEAAPVEAPATAQPAKTESAVLDKAPPPAVATPAVAPTTAAQPESKAPADDDGMDDEARHLYLKAVAKWESGDQTGAGGLFAQILNRQAPPETKRAATLKMARLYDTAQDWTKAVMMYEKFRQVYPQDPEMPTVLLRLGTIYRTMGAYDNAIARFYQVLNSTLAADPQSLAAIQKLAMKARLEIAETYTESGNMEEARKIYSRLQLLDLSDADRARVRFRTAYLYNYLKNYPAAIKSLQSFLSDYPHSQYSPEARYLLAQSLLATNDKAGAFKEVIGLLKDESDYSGDAARVNYWKRRTGNELANQFYQQGDYVSALTIYQTLARLNADPDWQWPAIYQIGLCFERLNLPDRAIQAYQEITKTKLTDQETKEMDESLSLLRDMADWRLNELDWASDFQKRMQILIYPNTLDKS